MNLVIDIGNTRSKIGLFQENTLVEQAIWTDWTLAELLRYGNHSGANNVLFSSVAAPNPALKEGLEDHFNVLELTHETPLPFRNLYQTPQTLGKDRLAGGHISAFAAAIISSSVRASASMTMST